MLVCVVVEPRWMDDLQTKRITIESNQGLHVRNIENDFAERT